MNLVSNGNFEIYSQCPNNASQITYATGWHNAALTPDYFNACSPTSVGTNVPNAGFGYQPDCCGGGGYAGIYVLYISTANNDGREYMYTKLIDTLKSGHKYLASMYVSNTSFFNYAIATVGMLFTDTAIALVSPQSFINANPQVKNNTLLADTVNWMLIQDTITAIGNEIYLTLGNFNTSVTCDSVKIFSTGVDAAYYYIDGVSVYDVATIGIEQNKNNAEVNVYPNPAQNNFTIEVSNNQKQSISIFDVNGKQV
ncbi:MAG TPA: T9SS type A sorting domain-containing protein, partial [Bacteroidia bacterium]|nr:T9SS type A sorting domain-containing protein [Bacteroidia bacterium]